MRTWMIGTGVSETSINNALERATELWPDLDEYVSNLENPQLVVFFLNVEARFEKGEGAPTGGEVVWTFYEVDFASLQNEA